MSKKKIDPTVSVFSNIISTNVGIEDLEGNSGFITDYSQPKSWAVHTSNKPKD